MTLEYIHGRKVLHRDIKVSNIFLTGNNTVKLGDFGISKVLESTNAGAQTVVGTPYYMSPEVCESKPYTYKADSWALGCVLYEMAALRPPFVASDLQSLYKKVCAGIFDRIPMVYSGELANVISSLLKVDPNKRPDTD